MGVLLRCLMSFLEGVSRDCAFLSLGSMEEVAPS
jgi:hypothetical protein